MERQILVPLDGSALGEAVIPSVIPLAQATESSLLLLQVIEPPLSFGGTVWPVVDVPWEITNVSAVHAEACAYLTDVAQRIERFGVRVRSELQIGDAAPAIVRYVQEHQRLWMIAMATHGRSGLSRLFFGSVAEKVLHVTTAPLMLCRAQAQQSAELRSYKTILVPLDGSLFAERALEQARMLAAATGARLLLLSVAPPLDDSGLGDAGAVPLWRLAAGQAEREQLITYLEWQAKELEAQGLEVQTMLLSGDPADTIVQLALAQADLIVMATHGRSGVQRLWLGSVAQHVVRHATVPALLVRTEVIVRKGARSAHNSVPLQAMEG